MIGDVSKGIPSERRIKRSCDNNACNCFGSHCTYVFITDNNSKDKDYYNGSRKINIIPELLNSALAKSGL